MSSLLAAAGLGFLIAVLWFDLMYDVQARGHRGPTLPDEVLTSITGYYARVTTAARPMNLLVAATMLITLVSLGWQVVDDGSPVGPAIVLALTAVAVTLAATRTVPTAVRLGTRTGSAEDQSEMARTVLRDHLTCLTLVTIALVTHLATGAA